MCVLPLNTIFLRYNGHFRADWSHYTGDHHTPRAWSDHYWKTSWFQSPSESDHYRSDHFIDGEPMVTCAFSHFGPFPNESLFPKAGLGLGSGLERVIRVGLEWHFGVGLAPTPGAMSCGAHAAHVPRTAGLNLRWGKVLLSHPRDEGRLEDFPSPFLAFKQMSCL